MFAKHAMSAWMLALYVAFAALPVHAQSAPSGTQATPRGKVVIQMSDADPAKWNLALNNARNLQSDAGAANIDIELVAYGPGIGMLKADSVVATASTRRSARA